MSQLTCEYHPNREAIDKCHDCQRLICLEDKQIVQSQSTGIMRKNIQGGIYCSICYYNMAKSVNSDIFPKQLAGAISFIVIAFFGGFVLLFSILGGISNFLIYFFIVFIAIALIVIWFAQYLISSLSTPPIDIGRARLLHERLIRSRTSVQPPSSKSYCMHCGATVFSKMAKCLSCGEELYPAK